MGHMMQRYAQEEEDYVRSVPDMVLFKRISCYEIRTFMHETAAMGYQCHFVDRFENDIFTWIIVIAVQL